MELKLLMALRILTTIDRARTLSRLQITLTENGFLRDPKGNKSPSHPSIIDKRISYPGNNTESNYKKYLAHYVGRAIANDKRITKNNRSPLNRYPCSICGNHNANMNESLCWDLGSRVTQNWVLPATCSKVCD